MTAVIHPVKHSTRLNGEGSGWGSEEGLVSPHSPPPRQGGAGTELEPGLGSGSSQGDPRSRPEPTRGGAEEEGAFPKGTPLCSTPPPIRSHTALTVNPLPLAPTLTYTWVAVLYLGLRYSSFVSLGLLGLKVGVRFVVWPD